MAKTFDAVWEAQDLNFMYLRARTTLAWDDAPFVGAPFNLLSWPYLVVNKSYHLFKSSLAASHTTRSKISSAGRTLAHSSSATGLLSAAKKLRRPRKVASEAVETIQEGTRQLQRRLSQGAMAAKELMEQTLSAM